MKAWAHLYADRGWPVLPLVGKVPAIQSGVHSATTDPELVERMWSERRRANVGIRCDNWLVVDVDPRSMGDHTMAGFTLEHGRLPETLSARTGGGGWHCVFNKPAGDLRGKLGPGVDLRRGPGQYIVAAPSTHPETGQRYRWIEGLRPVVDAPDWLVSLVVRPERLEESRGWRETPSGDGMLRRARAWLERADGAVSGQGGHDRTFHVAAKLVDYFGLGEGDAVQLLLEWNQRCCPPWRRSEIERKVREAMRMAR